MSDNSHDDEISEDDLNPRRRGLGRGLNALFEDEEGVYPQADADGHTPGAQRRIIGIDQLEPGEFQPRRDFDPESLDHLAESIAAHGILQPLLVRPKPDFPDTYEIIAGERRWRAAQKAQIHEIPAIIRELSDQEALEIALIENLQREDLNPLDESYGYKRLMDEFGHTQEKLAGALGKSRSHIANMMRLLNLPEGVQSYVREGKLSAGHARALVTADDADALARKIISQGLSVRQAEKLAASAQDSQKQSRKKAKKPEKDVDTRALEEEMSNILGMQVTLDVKDGKSGTLKIDYASLDQLDEVLHRLSHNPGRNGLDG